MSEVEIKVAEEVHLKAINGFLATHFHDKEPLESSHVDKSDKMTPDDEFLLDCIGYQTSLLAFLRRRQPRWSFVVGEDFTERG